MKKLQSAAGVLITIVILMISCHKNVVEVINTPKNKPPIANAGGNIILTLPQRNTDLDGSGSSDPDGTIASYTWKKISGPLTFLIEDPSASVTKVKDLERGIYEFQLTVVDDKGDSSRDVRFIEVKDPPPSLPVISTSFTEEFDTVYKLVTKGWAIRDNSGANAQARWKQGAMGKDKAGHPYGFPAYSFANSQDEFAYASVATTTYYPVTAVFTFYSVNSWLITPVLSVKNGDKFSFYTRGEEGTSYGDRLQVLMNKSSGSSVGYTTSSVGEFTISLLDINSGQVPDGYPKTWTKYEYVFSGINGNIDTRIAFRYFVPSTIQSKGVGIDLFKFESF
jgi:hypothetical protein